jgi:hypothetical protein
MVLSISSNDRERQDPATANQLGKNESMRRLSRQQPVVFLLDHGVALAAQLLQLGAIEHYDVAPGIGNGWPTYFSGIYNGHGPSKSVSSRSVSTKSPLTLVSGHRHLSDHCSGPRCEMGKREARRANGGLLSGAASGDYGFREVGTKHLDDAEVGDWVRQRTDTTIRLRSN